MNDVQIKTRFRTWSLRLTLMLGLVLVAAGCSKKDASLDDLPEGAVATQSEGWNLVTSVDDQGRLVTSVSPKPGYRVNTDFPWQLQVGESSQSGQQAVRFDEKNARFVTKVDAEDIEALEGQLTFSVCNDHTCLTPRETVHWKK